MLELFEQLLLENQLLLQNAMPRTQLWNFPPHLSPHSNPKRLSQCQRNKIPHIKSGSSKSNLQFNDQDTGSSTQFQRSQNQSKSSRQPPFNAAAIDIFLKDFFSVLQFIPVSTIIGDKTFSKDYKSGLEEYKVDVQLLSLSRSLSASATSFDIALYADNGNKFHVQNAFTTPNITLSTAYTTELT